jgi:hypothetical protein
MCILYVLVQGWASHPGPTHAMIQIFLYDLEAALPAED